MCIIVYDKGYGFADDKGFQSYPIELSLDIFACINLKILAAQGGLKNKERVIVTVPVKISSDVLMQTIIPLRLSTTWGRLLTEGETFMQEIFFCLKCLE